VYGASADRSAVDAFLDGSSREIVECRPQSFLDLGRDRDMLMGQQRRDPFGRPGTFVAAIDMPQRLERDRPRLVVMIPAEPERMVCAAHRQNRSTRREALVEDVDLAARVAAELERQQREQDRFAGAGRADDKHMTDVADMRG
jgi:hypothetical protein